MKQKKTSILAALGLAAALLASAAFSACTVIVDPGTSAPTSSPNQTTAPTQSSGNETTSPTAGTEIQPGITPDYVEQTPEAVPTADLAGLFENVQTPSGTFSITAKNGSSIEVSGSTYTLTAKDTYVLSGVLTDGQIIVDAGSEQVTLELSNVSLTSSKSAAILVKKADKVTLTVQAGTVNVIHDTMAKEVDSETENYDGAVYAACDLTLNGTGTLIVDSLRNNGIKTKDDLKITELNLKVTAYNTALKGNDSVTVESGKILLYSETSDGIKTSNSDVSSKGKQKGSVTISGGTVEIRSAMDGIQAAYDVEISGDALVTVLTADYAGQTGVDVGEKLYLIVPMASYSSANAYYAYFYNETAGVFVQAEFETMVYNGSRNSFYGLSLKVPGGYTNVAFFLFGLGQQPSTESYTAASDGEAINTSMNGYLFSSIGSGRIDGDWVKLSTNSSNSNKTTYSSKGIKAANEIRIAGGAVSVSSMDDGLHANSGDKLENGANGIGKITISGGKIEITSADDGVHADGDLVVTGGSLNVKESHEGMEGNQILISGGSVFVRGDDDGLNACAGASTPLIKITGGYLDVTTPSGDTDAIDSNGSFTQTGGFILVRAGSTMGGVAGSVDVDGKIEVSGGMIAAVGGICEVPSNGVNFYVAQGTTLSSGTYTLVNSKSETILSFTLSSNYSSIWIAGSDLVTGESYELKRDGTAVLNWTQSAGQTGSYSGGGFGPGGGWPRGH